jgi:tetratricopeptide (TPR) repeat protein
VTRSIKAVVVIAALLLVGLAAFMIGANLWAGHHYRLAEKDIARRDFRSAHAHLETYLKVNSYDGDAHFLAARTARRAELMDDARRHLEDCERLGSVSRDSVGLERMLIAVQRGEVAQHEESLMNCIDSDHEDAVIILEAMIEGYVRSFKVAQAGACITQLLKRQPDNPLAYLRRGELLDQGQSTQAAILDYQKALELEPELDDARRCLAEDLIHSNRVEEALTQFEVLHAKHSEDLRIRVGLAECHVNLGHVEEALALVDAVLDEVPADDPRAFGAMTLRAKIGLLLNQPADTEKWSRKALVLAPNSRENLYNLYHSLDMLERHDEARVYQDKWSSAEDEALRIMKLETRIGQSPHDTAMRHEIGVFHLGQGRDSLGLIWLVSALQEDPSYRPTLLALADYYEKKGDAVRVKEFRRRAEASAASQ